MALKFSNRAETCSPNWNTWFHQAAFWLPGLLSLITFPAGAQQLTTLRLDSLLTSLATHDKLMGSLTLSHAGRVVYSRAFGYQQAETKTPATPATRYRIGSATKMFTAVLILQLIEEKKLTLITPLAAFFPQLPNARTITIDQLLGHRSGLYNFTEDTAWVSGHMPAKTPAQMLQLIGQGQPEFAPGTKAAYNNSAYVLLGYIVERLTKLPYAQALQKRVLTKVGLLNTYCGGPINPPEAGGVFLRHQPRRLAARGRNRQEPGGRGRDHREYPNRFNPLFGSAVRGAASVGGQSEADANHS